MNVKSFVSMIEHNGRGLIVYWILDPGSKKGWDGSWDTEPIPDGAVVVRVWEGEGDEWDEISFDDCCDMQEALLEDYFEGRRNG